MGGRGASSASTSKRMFDGKTHIQSIGEVNAYKVENIQKGDILLYNYGYTSKVKSIEQSKSGKSYKVTTISSETGKEYQRTMRKGRLLAIASTESKNEKDLRMKTIAKKV